MRLNHLRMLASVALLILSGLAGCATVPDRRVVPEGFAPPGTPVDVRLLWDGAGLTIYYDQTQGSWVGDSLGGGIVGVLLLPVALTRDAAVSAANAARERQARWIADSVTGLPDRASVENRLADALRAELGWVAPRLADCESPGGPANCDVTLDMPLQLSGATPDPLVLTVSPVFSLRTDARALLFEYRLGHGWLQSSMTSTALKTWQARSARGKRKPATRRWIVSATTTYTRRRPRCWPLMPGSATGASG